jgi:hypothetical protein
VATTQFRPSAAKAKYGKGETALIDMGTKMRSTQSRDREGPVLSDSRRCQRDVFSAKRAYHRRSLRAFQ